MICSNCGAAIMQGAAFCTNCGTPVSTGGGDAAMNMQEAAASLESAVSANQEAMEPIEARVALDEAQAAAAEQAPSEQVWDAAPSAYVPPANNDAPQAPQGYQSGVATAGVPFYQQGASPNAHYSSQRSYEGNAYGQDTGQAAQPGYQQPSYGQPQGAPAPAATVWPAQSATNRAFGMVLYVAGLLGIIFALAVRDQSDEFITHHLNNNVVILIGSVVATVLTPIGLGFLVFIYLFVMIIMGIISAYNGDMKELPLIGKLHIVK